MKETILQQDDDDDDDRFQICSSGREGKVHVVYFERVERMYVVKDGMQ